jgi:hypothetical protein
VISLGFFLINILNKLIVINMNKKQLYESIMSSVAKQVKKSLNESSQVGKHEFSHEDLEEIKEYML